MKKIITACITIMVLSLMACSDDSSSPTSANPNNSTNNTSSSPQNPTPTTNNPPQPTTSNTTNYNNSRKYAVVLGGICQAFPVAADGTATTGCQQYTYETFIALYSYCDMSQMHVQEYDYYSSEQIHSLLISNYGFTSFDADNIKTEIDKCGTIFWGYNAASGLNFIYVEEFGDGAGLLKTGVSKPSTTNKMNSFDSKPFFKATLNI